MVCRLLLSLTKQGSRSGGPGRSIRVALRSSLAVLLLLVALFAAATTAQAASATWSSLGTVSPALKNAYAPQVAETPTGYAAFVWARLDGTTQCSSSGCSRIEARFRYTPSGRLTGDPLTEPLSAAGQDARSPQVAMAANGDAIFVWERSDGTTQCQGSSCSRIEARFHYATTDTYSPVQILSAAGQNAHAPKVAIAPNGDAVFAWKRFDGTTQCSTAGCSRIQTRTRAASTGALSAVQTLSDAGRNAQDPQVAVDSGDNAVFAWTRFDGTTQCSSAGCSRIQARNRQTTGLLSVVRTLSPPGRDASAPALSADWDGGLDPSRSDAIALWSRYDAARPTRSCCFRIQAAEQTVVNTTSERFQSISWEMTRSFDQATVISDFNGDGLDDFLVSRHHYTDEDHLSLQRADGSFWRGFTFPPLDRHGCAAGDVNGDSRVDVYCMIGGRHGTGVKENELWIAQGNGTYVNQAALWGVTDPYGRGRLPILFDFNDDGRLDLYITNYTDEGPRPDGQRNENILYLNTGSTFVEQPVTATGSYGSTCVEAGDWDGDGFLDLLVCGPDLHLFRNVGGQSTMLDDGLLGATPVSSPRHAVLSDVNGDGRLDLVIVKARQLQIRLNLGSGARFSQIHHSTPLVDGMAVAVGDLTGDAVPDIYVVQAYENVQNADDVLLEGPSWTPVAVPPAYRGHGSSAEIINVSGRRMVLVTNGHLSHGPIQFIRLR
jgi:hypothetical protein